MSLASQVPTTARPDNSDGIAQNAGIIVIEGNALTPLGPKMVYANAQALSTTGYEKKSLEGSPLGLIYDRNDLTSLIGKLPTIAERSTYCWMDRDLMRADGRRTRCHWTIRPTKRENTPGSYFILTFEPLSEATAAPLPPEEVEPRIPEVKPPSRVESNVRSDSVAMTAGGVAHDFKNALQIIKSNLELAGLESGALKRAVAPFLEEAEWALSDAEILARQMLALSRKETDKHRVFRIHGLMKRVSRLCTAGSRTRSRLNIHDGVRCVHGDPAQIYQVLHNLVTNARQAMPNGGTIDLVAGNADLTDDNKYKVAAGHYTVISVRDRGDGIPPEVLPHIFDRDFTTKHDGSGFGLASCKEIVEAHGGIIRVASLVGVGTEFLVFLPSTESTEDAMPVICKEPKSSGRAALKDFSGNRILIIEDDQKIARATQSILKHLGCNFLVAIDAEEAMQIFREHHDSAESIDAALIDITLPGGLDGIQVFKKLRMIDPDLVAIATSGYFDDENPPGILEHGFKAAVPKPYSIADLSSALERAFA